MPGPNGDAPSPAAANEAAASASATPASSSPASEKPLTLDAFLSDPAGAKKTAASSTGKPDEKVPAPGDGQPAGDTKAKPGESKPEDKPIDLEAKARQKLGLTGTGEEGLAFYRKRYEESSTEAKRLATERKAFESTLAKHGLKVAQKGDGSVGFIADEKYVGAKAETIAREIRDGIDRKRLEELADDPDAFVNEIVAEALKRGLNAPVPTMTDSEITIGEQDKRAIREKLVAERDAEGNAVLDGFVPLERWIQAQLDDPSLPEPIRRAIAATPEAYEWAMRAAHARAAVALLPDLMAEQAARAERARKAESARTDPSVAAESSIAGGKSGHGGNGKTAAANDPFGGVGLDKIPSVAWGR